MKNKRAIEKRRHAKRQARKHRTCGARPVAATSSVLRAANERAARGDLAGVEQTLRTAIARNPRDAELHLQLADWLYKSKKQDTEALEEARQAYQLKPNAKHLIVVAGIADKVEGAGATEARLEEALEMEPRNPLVLRVVSRAHALGIHPEKALPLARRLIEIAPRDARSWEHLGTALRENGEIDEALTTFDRAIQLHPDDPLTHVAKAAALLTVGRFGQAWGEWEWRMKDSAARGQLPAMNTYGTNRTQIFQRWWKGTPLPERTLTLWPDAGHGDAFQFVRFAPLVKAQCARLVAVTWEAEAPVIARCAAIDEVAVMEDDPGLEEGARWISTLSLAKYFVTTEADIPRNPYLFANPFKVQNVPLFVRAGARLRIGIAWGCGDISSASVRRVCPLQNFAPLMEIPGLEFYSLQIGGDEKQLQDVSFGGRIADLTDTLRVGWGETAEVVANLDLIISVDTSVAHLAGGMGRPTWLLLSTPCEWRWMRDREDSPWYPTMRLFRQPTPGDWQSVLARVADELRALVVQKQAA